MPLVTIDFHNTLFRCDDWFRLEIADLPIATFTELAPQLPADQDIGALKERAQCIYQQIRREAVQSGVECDAVCSMVRVASELNLALPRQSIENAVRTVMWEAVPHARPRSGAIELVTDLADKSIPLAVVSSAAYHPFLEWCLARFDLRDSFSHVVTSASCGIYKSDPAIYQYTLDLFSATSRDAVHIGDSHRYDVVSAGQIGYRTILLTNTPDHLYDPMPDALITSLGAATTHLDRLLSA